jgi:3-hydroxymyristoyl/3-hydroxydecanoyl-(acyl carrier protein) dehydratase
MESDLPIVEASTADGDGAVTLRFTVPQTLPALEGHFPGNPIVPGYMIVRWAVTLSSTAFDASWYLFKARSVKFLLPVRPGTVLQARFQRTIPEAGPGSANESAHDQVRLSFEFRKSENDQLVAHGQLALRYRP